MRRLLLLWVFCMFVQACSTEIEVYAPQVESYYIMSVLDPTRDTQYVRLSRVFQSPGDAVAYADTANLTVKGWDVWLEGAGKIWKAEEIEMPKEAGDFNAFGHSVYAFETKWADKLVPGEAYHLFLQKPDDSGYVISARTIVPTAPRITAPSEPSYHAPTNTYSLPTWEFTQDQQVEFLKGSGFGCEARVILHYSDAAGTVRQAFWGPTSIRQTPFRCSASVDFGEMCVWIPENSVPNYFRTFFAGVPGARLLDSVKLAHSVQELSKVAHVEVTTADSVLTRFLIGNDAGNYGLNLLMDKPEYSNFPAPHYGIFGAINRDSQWIFYGECAKYLSGLIPFPPPGCN